MVVILRGNDVVVEWRLAFSSEEFEYEAGRFYVYAGVKQTDAEYEIRDNVLYSTIPGNQLEAGLYSMVFAFTSYKGDELVLNKRKVSGAFVITEDEEEVVDGPVICDTSAYGRTLYSLLDVDSSSDNSSVNGAEEGNVLTFQNGLWRGMKPASSGSTGEGTDTQLREYLDKLFQLRKDANGNEYINTPYSFASEKTVSSLGVGEGGEGGGGGASYLYQLADVESNGAEVAGAVEGYSLVFKNGKWQGVKVEADLTDVEGKIELITVTLEDHEARIEKVESSVGDTDKKIAANTQLITGLREYLNSLFAVVYKEDGTIDYVRTPHNFASDKTVSSLGVGGDGGAGSLGFSILQSWDDDSDASEVMALGSNLGRELYDSISVIKDENLKGISSRVDDIESELDSVSQTLTQHGTSIQNNRVSISEINERISPIEKVFNEIKTWFTLEGDVLRTTYSLASDQTVSSLGVGSDNGGSGVSYDRLDNWDNYVEGDGSVLSSDLGYGLLERIIDLEEGTSGDYASIEEKVDKNTNAITALSTSLNDFLTGVDVDDTINRWKELEKFLEGYKETATLADLLKGKVDTEAYNTAINGINETLGIHTTAINSNTANIASINTTLLNHDTRITNNANAITKIEKTLADWFTLEDGVLHSKYGLASDKTVSSLGIGSSEGGGASYNRLDAWSSYTADKAGYVLSALLGWDLNTRLGKIESGDIGDISLSNYYTKSEVFNRTEIDNMLLGYAKSEDIPAIPTALKNPYSLKFGSKSYDGSTEMTITAADLGALTEHQTIYNLTMQAGAFSVKTFDPNGSAQTVNIPTTTDHIAEGSNKYYSNTLVSNYLTGAVSSVLTSNLTASRALISNANGKIAVSAVTSTELGYLDGVTSAIQTQLNALSSRIKAYEDILKIEEEGKLLHATVALASDSTLSSLGVGSDEDGGVGSVIDLTNVVTDILPAADDTYSIGGADLRWSDIWGVIGRFDTLLADDIRTTDGVSYVTQAWVENNFVKHATLDSYATLTYVSDAIEGLSLGTASQKDWAGAAATDPSRLVTEDWVLNKLQGYATTSVATTSANGLMSAAMVTKLNGIATGATAVTSSTVSGWGYTKNVGTVTGVKVNGTNYTPSNGIVDIGNVASYEAIADVVEDYLANDYALSSDTTDAVKLTTLSGRSQRITVSTLKTSLGLKALAYKDSIDLSAYAKTSQLENYYTKSEVHSYVAQEINTFNENLPVIPTKTSQLTNDSGFITSSAIPSLTGYAKLSSTNSFTAKQSFTAEIEVSKTDLVAPLTVQGTGNRAFVKFTSGSTNLGYLGFSAVNTPAWMPSDATEYLPLATQAWVEGKGYATTSDLNNLGDNIGAVVEANFARKATTLAGYGITDGVLAGAIDLTNSDYTGLQDWADNSPSFVGSFYDKTVWYNVISLRHRNGTYDGNAYGMLLYSQLTVKGASLKYIQQMGGTWDEKARTILDSSNFSSYALPLSGGTITSSIEQALTLYRLADAGGIGIKFSGEGKNAWVGFEPQSDGHGAYIYTNGHYLFLTSSGVAKLDNNTLIHSGNIGSYALTSSNYGTILNSIYAPKAITDSLINFKVGLSEGYINTFKCDTINGYSPVHSGNIGSQSVSYATSAGNADTLDGYHAGSFSKVLTVNLTAGQILRIDMAQQRGMLINIQGTNTNRNALYFVTGYQAGTTDRNNIRVIKKGPFDVYFNGASENGAVYIVNNTWTSGTDVVYVHSFDTLGIISEVVSAIPSDATLVSSSDGNTLATLASNVASATKLATARTIWGQSFDGSGNISGSLTITGDILPSSTDTRSLGSTSSYWKNLYVGIITGHYQSGDVVKFSGSINANEGNVSCKSLTVNGVAITGSGGSFSGGTVANDTLFSGVVSIGSSMPSSYASKLYVNGSATFEGFIDAFGGIAGDGWEIMESGDAYFTSVSQGSDYNLKNIIGDVRLSLGMMACAPLVLFDWKNKSNTKHNVGTIAQYWQGVLPEVVTKTMNGTLALSYGELGVAMGISLANILEDTNGRVATVEEEIKTLKEENKRLKERVAELEAA